MNKKARLHLIELAARYENIDFTRNDPSGAMHRVTGVENQELMAFIASCLSYGSRKQFLPKIDFFINESSGQLHDWILNGDYRAALPDSCKTFYRLQNYHNMNQLVHALHELLLQHGSLGNFMRMHATTGPQAVEAMTQFFKGWDVGHCVPKNTQSPCKRLCMFLRWMVRDLSPVDLGLWTFIDKRTLLIPLDTHVLQEATRLKLIHTKTSSMSTAVKLTQELRKVFPDDPLKGDFALFGFAVDQ